MAQQEVTNFGRFYASFNTLPFAGDREDYKRSMVRQYTDGRTEHLHEMTRNEYDECCADLEQLSGRRSMLRKERSATLKLMQRMGIDTSDWAAVNNFCRNPRIAGKQFCAIRLDEFQQLRAKLFAIKRNGGLKPKAQEAEAAPAAMVMAMVKGGEA